MMTSYRSQRGWGGVAIPGLITAFAGLLLTGCGPAATKGGKGADAVKRDLTPRNVSVTKAVLRPLERMVPAIGSLAPLDQAVISTKVPRRIEMFDVDLGSVVKKGALLGQLERRDYELKLMQAEALLAQARARLGLSLEGSDDRVNSDSVSSVKQAQALLAEAKANRERVLKLSQQKILSQSEQETADASYHVALNRYQEALEEVRNRQALLAQRRVEFEIAKQQLTDTLLQAPFDGAVQERRANAGEYLAIGTPVLTLVRLDPLRLKIEVPERQALNIQMGQEVRVRVEGDTNVYSGVIKRLGPAITGDTRMLLVEADVSGYGKLRPGQFARADVVVDPNEKAVTIPLNALSVFAGLEKVFVVEQGKAVERNVVTGRRGGDWIEITKGVKSGEVVVLNPGSIQNGQPLTIQTGPPPAKPST
ncbi:MAG TPA: efflux RND transporter periplasmic adaptor subunit [Roseimicrobium sp.]|nr:efflux RND transporter periplasmic adaptor subunit [Roseimicrobium sp.]